MITRNSIRKMLDFNDKKTKDIFKEFKLYILGEVHMTWQYGGLYFLRFQPIC